MIRKVCFVSREMEGIAGAGGLKDVVRGLAGALRDRGVDVTVILPRYGFVEKGDFLHTVHVPLKGELHLVDVSTRKIDGISVRLLESPYYRSKSDVYVYRESDAPKPQMAGKGHIDANEMNVILQAGAMLSLIESGDSPDIIHGHDAHTGLLPLYVKTFSIESGFFRKTGVLVTIHNAGLAYQQIPGNLEETVFITGLPAEYLEKCLLDGSVNPFLAAGVFGSINTVSPGYAQELLTGNDPYSGSLGSAFLTRKIELKGIYNGIDPESWTDKTADFRTNNGLDKFRIRKFLADRIHNRTYGTITRFGADLNSDIPWILFHGRITPQKGLESILELPGAPENPDEPHMMIIYGQGDSDIEDRITAKVRNSENWVFLRGYDSRLTEFLIAASSFIAVPSIWEPCGQIDMIGQLLGSLPVVRDVGGLAKVRNRYDGFKYSPDDRAGLNKYLSLAVEWEWKKQGKVSVMRRRAENVVYGRRIWRKVLVRGYLPLYRKVRRKSRRIS